MKKKQEKNKQKKFKKVINVGIRKKLIDLLFILLHKQINKTHTHIVNVLAKSKFAIKRNGNDNKDLKQNNMDSVPEKRRKKELKNVFLIGEREKGVVAFFSLKIEFLTVFFFQKLFLSAPIGRGMGNG